MALNVSKSRKLKRRLAYVLMPVFFAFLGLVILYFAMKPIYNDTKNYFGLVFANSAPDFNQSLNDNFIGVSKNPKSVDNADVNLPKYNDKYAEISCSELGISAPLYWGDSDVALRYGAGTYVGSNLPGYGSTILVAGHNTTFFKPLKNVALNNIIEVKTNYGNYKYKVVEITPHEFNDLSAVNFKSTKEQLVMYTCYPFSKMAGVKTERLFVYCDKISGPKVVNIEGDN